MEGAQLQSAARMRQVLSREPPPPAAFREQLLNVPRLDRDAWLDHVFGLDTDAGSVADDGPALPRGGVPYWPSSVDAVLRAVELADIQPTDVFVDVGAGVGRAAALVHLLTAAPVLGIEIQPQLVRAFSELTARLKLHQVAAVQGDAVRLAELAPTGSVFFLYCPFGLERLEPMLDGLEQIAARREIRVCCLDLMLPARPWLVPQLPDNGDLALFRTTRHHSRVG